MNLTIWDFVTVAGLIAAAQFLSTTWLKARIEESVKHEYAAQLEKLKSELQGERQKRDRTWLIKRDACLKALNIANGLLSNYSYQNVPADQMHPQEVDVAEVRACFNELACSCETADVLTQLKRIMFAGVSPDAIVDLRNAVRRELEFGVEEIDTDREKAFVGRVVGQKRKAPNQTPEPTAPSGRGSS